MRFQATQFHYDPVTKVYAAEASELGIAPGAMDSRVSLDGTLFHYYGTDHDASGEDIAGWRFKITMSAVQLNPALAGTMVLIIND
jgi:hypothetical protein